MEQFNTFLFVAWISFLLNIPLGLWRGSVKKLSLSWFVALHLSIPLVIIFRIHAGMSMIYVPVVILIAVLGQRTGMHILSKTNRLAQEPVE